MSTHGYMNARHWAWLFTVQLDSMSEAEQEEAVKQIVSLTEDPPAGSRQTHPGQSDTLPCRRCPRPRPLRQTHHNPCALQC